MRLILACLCAATTLPAICEPVKFLLPETNSVVTLSLMHDKEFSDDYRSIAIQSAGTTTSIIAHDPIHRIPASPEERRQFLGFADIPGLKLNSSRIFMVGNYLVDQKPHTLLFFFSQGYESDAASLLIVGFSDLGKPSKVFEREFELKSFEQAENGAIITGKESISQGLCSPADANAPSAATYDPYSMFLLRLGIKPLYLLEASREYNRKHYVWAGPRTREDYAVIENLPRHPKFYAVPGKELGKILAGVKCNP